MNAHDTDIRRSLTLLRREATPHKMIFTRSVSLTNFAVASSALCFQVFVLYPWHQQLDDSFEELKKEHRLLLQKINNMPLAPSEKSPATAANSRP
ncbi:hypothetical protein BDW42DRAFT_189779 [Aspergillus taichungensis]|uniref:Uncharacterized protein n=1 Tax=Aspergillus taichungensis TaxID=482145 RepID=A0A2J5I9T5_9EURO|nr:hypothetical protein BDW42DRAFT_189779 [Aspergillus taichungensis]